MSGALFTNTQFHLLWKEKHDHFLVYSFICGLEQTEVPSYIYVGIVTKRTAVIYLHTFMLLWNHWQWDNLIKFSPTLTPPLVYAKGWTQSNKNGIHALCCLFGKCGWAWGCVVAVACVATLVLNSLLQILVGYCVVVYAVSNCRDVISLTSMTSLPVVSSNICVVIWRVDLWFRLLMHLVNVACPS